MSDLETADNFRIAVALVANARPGILLNDQIGAVYALIDRCTFLHGDQPWMAQWVKAMQKAMLAKAMLARRSA